jgi:hypothetical protein
MDPMEKAFNRLLAILLASCVPLSLGAQKKDPDAYRNPATFMGLTSRQLASQVPPAKPDDVKSPEALVRALHDSVTSSKGKWDEKRLLSLCLPHTLFAYPERDKEGVTHLSVLSIEQIVKSGLDDNKKSDWIERTLTVHIWRHDNIAVAHYNGDARKATDGPVVERGVSICEMMFDGTRWWIVSDIWEDIGTDPWPKDFQPTAEKP